jgi:hypothetical protein
MKKMGKSALNKKPPTRRTKPQVTDLSNPAYYENKLIYMVEMLQEYAEVRSPTLKEFHIAAKDSWTKPRRAEIWRKAETHKGIKFMNPMILIVTNTKTGKEKAIEIYNRG